MIRAASESDASCAQIVKALATSANVLGCEKLFAVMYGGEDYEDRKRAEREAYAKKFRSISTPALYGLLVSVFCVLCVCLNCSTSPQLFFRTVSSQ